MMTHRYLLFSGGNLGDWALDEVQEGDVLVGVDRGALFLLQHGIVPAYAVGDFDSVNEAERSQIEQQVASVASCDPVMKDLTDTEMAFRWALTQQPTEIILLGAVGSRLDHTLANLHLLVEAQKATVPCRIVDEKNEVLLVDGTAQIKKRRYRYVSLLPLSTQVTGITLEGFLYPLHRATLTIGQSLGISNELLGSHGTVSVESGQLLLIQSLD
ncbi:thiamine diphosphokinase [Brevibacillus humidisoli]|uniref:thiamine diphosphokinase n=1 Tax=Brevibacillus humidisoli TaxID=2895522 RepID=UPI001E53B2CB|nr:thiamine diphosphokinase [Brevibacillus humidisoli]UFJ40253.1 thiamine diphosphokinase [Brevibacillus humidisoli]